MMCTRKRGMFWITLMIIRIPHDWEWDMCDILYVITRPRLSYLRNQTDKPEYETCWNWSRVLVYGFSLNALYWNRNYKLYDKLFYFVCNPLFNVILFPFKFEARIRRKERKRRRRSRIVEWGECIPELIRDTRTDKSSRILHADRGE